MSKKLKTTLAILLLIPCMFVFVACSWLEGKSAYDIAVDNGFVGTEQEWLESLKGEDGAYAGQGKSAYEVAVDNGFEGTEVEWLASLQGAKGDSGDDGMGEVTAKALLSTVSIVCPVSDGTKSGSGVIISLDKTTGDAYIMTNYHVVYYNAILTNIYVYLYGMEGVYAEGNVQKDYAISATYVGGSLTYDIAVLKVTGSDILKNSDAIAATVDTSQTYAGETVVAVGNPSGAGLSATKGVVSVDCEQITLTLADEVTQSTMTVMRIDAAVNSGNSGGGLYDKNGNLIGIVNAKIQSSNIENMSFAIPSLVAYGIYQNIVSQETDTNIGTIKVQDYLLGVQAQLTASSAVYDTTLGVTKIKETTKVVEVLSTGNSYGKLKSGDVFVSIKVGNNVFSIDRDYMIDAALLYAKQHDVITVTVLRDSQYVDVLVTLSQTPTAIN